jgi:hypothetical protein
MELVLLSENVGNVSVEIESAYDSSEKTIDQLVGFVIPRWSVNPKVRVQLRLVADVCLDFGSDDVSQLCLGSGRVAGGDENVSTLVALIDLLLTFAPNIHPGDDVVVGIADERMDGPAHDKRLRRVQG